MSESVIRPFIPVVLAAFVIACASGQPTSVQQDSEAKMFTAPSDAGKGRVYVVRPAGFAGAAILTQIVVDGRIAAAVGPKNYFVLDLSAGDHIFAPLGQSKQQSLRLNVEPGKLYFIEVHHIAGTVTLLSDEEGRSLVRGSTRIEPTI